MRISFFLTTPKRVSADNFVAGGAEMAAKGLGDELSKLGHDVHFYGNCEPSANYHQYEQYFEDVHDRIIMVRASNAIFRPVKREKFILWTGDAYDQPNNFVLNAPFVVGSRIDKVVFKSEWQKQSAYEHFPVLAAMDKAITMPNGVVRNYFFDTISDKSDFVCTSRIFRGLDRLLHIWPRLYRELGREVHLFSDVAGLYNDADSDPQYAKLREALSNMSGVVVRATVAQRQMVELMHRYEYMLYPNFSFVESSCNSALESMCAGTPVITTARAGLIETVGLGYGKLIEDAGNLDQYTDEIIKFVNENEKNPERYLAWQEKRFELIDRFAWDVIAPRWVEEVLS